MRSFVDFAGQRIPIDDRETGTPRFAAELFVPCLGPATTPTPRPFPPRSCRTGLRPTFTPSSYVQARSDEPG